MNYYKELVKKFHPDLNNNSKHATVILKVINKLYKENNINSLKNLYYRLI